MYDVCTVFESVAALSCFSVPKIGESQTTKMRIMSTSTTKPETSRYDMPHGRRRPSIHDDVGPMNNSNNFNHNHNHNNNDHHYRGGFSVGVGMSSAGAATATAMNSKSRRLYIGNVPFHAGLTDTALLQLFSALYVAGFGGQVAGMPLPVLSFWLHGDGKFGFMELRGEQETVNMMVFNQTTLHGRMLKVNRPSDFRVEVHAPHVTQLATEKVNARAVVQLCEQLDGIVVPPPNMVAQARRQPVLTSTEETEEEKSSSDKMKDRDNGSKNTNNNMKEEDKSEKGDDEASNEIEYRQAQISSGYNQRNSRPQSLSNSPIGRNNAGGVVNNMDIDMEVDDDNQNTSPSPAKRARYNGRDDLSSSENVRTANNDVDNDDWAKDDDDGFDVNNNNNKVKKEDNTNSGDVENTKVISLKNLVTDDDLTGSEEQFEELVYDVHSECSSYGTLVKVEIPRNGPFKGTAFVEFTDSEGAKRAIAELAGRVFDGQKVVAVGVPVSSAHEAVNRAG